MPVFGEAYVNTQQECEQYAEAGNVHEFQSVVAPTVITLRADMGSDAEACLVAISAPTLRAGSESQAILSNV